MARFLRRTVALWLPAAVGVSVMTAVVYAGVQQSFRRGADDPQIQMARDAAAQLSAGAAPVTVARGPSVDIAASLAPYVIVYGADDGVLASTALLDGHAPTPPTGVLAAARDHGSDAVTWQPRSGVRQALEVVSWSGPAGTGTVLAGRSLQEVESRIDDLTVMVGVGWAFSLMAIAVAAAFGGWVWDRGVTADTRIDARR